MFWKIRRKKFVWRHICGQYYGISIIWILTINFELLNNTCNNFDICKNRTFHFSLFSAKTERSISPSVAKTEHLECLPSSYQYYSLKMNKTYLFLSNELIWGCKKFRNYETYLKTDVIICYIVSNQKVFRFTLRYLT